MSSGQILLILAAMALLSLITVQANQSLLTGARTVISGQAALTGISLGQGYMEEAQIKAFDEIVLNGAPASVTYLTSPGSLGPDGGESYPDFDDIDDYHGLAIDLVQGGIDFHVAGDCQYVTQGNLENQSGSRTYYKRLQIVISSSFMEAPVTISQIVSFF